MSLVVLPSEATTSSAILPSTKALEEGLRAFVAMDTLNSMSKLSSGFVNEELLVQVQQCFRAIPQVESATLYLDIHCPYDLSDATRKKLAMQHLKVIRRQAKARSMEGMSRFRGLSGGKIYVKATYMLRREKQRS